MKRISTFLDEDDYRWLHRVSKHHDRPVAELIRRAISDYRLREGSVLGEAHVPIDLSSPDYKPSKEENSVRGLAARLQHLEKCVFNNVAPQLSPLDPTTISSNPHLPEYIKKHL